MIEAQKQTMKIYKDSILALKGAEKFTSKSGEGLRKHKLYKLKRGRGRPKKYPDIITCASTDELCEKLVEFDTAKETGNTGLDNSINSILDEMLEIKFINKDEYDILYKNIFL